MINENNKYADKTKSYTIPSFYNYYLQNIERDTEYDISYQLYKKILVDYFKYIQREVLENSKEFKLPCRLGTIEIVKSRPKEYSGKSLRIDYQATKQEGKLVYLLNEHSDYYKYRIYWNKQQSTALNKTRYQLIMTRANKRRLAAIIKNKEHDYREL